MKKFIVYLLVIIITISLGFAVFYLVRDNEIISISSASIYKDVGDNFSIDINHLNKKSFTEITVTSSDDSIVSGKYDATNNVYNAIANKGGVARIRVMTSNAKFRNLWCDVIVGDGSIESPFYISSAEQLAAIGMGEMISVDGKATGVYAGKAPYEKYTSDSCYKLIGDIDLSDVYNNFWIPLRHFNGRFDGNGLTIRNLYIDKAGYVSEFNGKSDADSIFMSSDGSTNVGLFATLGSNAIVYNLKIENFRAQGKNTYTNFGAIAGINYGTIERVEVKDAVISATTSVLGGIAGKNITTEYVSTISENLGQYLRTVARIDRCSINVTFGKNVEANTFSGVTGVVGGIAGQNEGGVIVYSYVRGYNTNSDVLDGGIYIGNSITYGGIVGRNVALNNLNKNENAGYDTVYQGASIRDCYSDLKTFLTTNTTSTIGGVIGENSDYTVGHFENNNTQNIVNNYLFGLYYNKENLNLAQDGFDKQYKGIAKFTLNNNNLVTLADKRTIAYGLTEEEMKDSANFISHSTKEVVFGGSENDNALNDDVVTKGIVEKHVLWLFNTIWLIDGNTNDGMPYLNYQVEYIPDDFETVGVPIVPNTNNDYYFDIEIDYPISILSTDPVRIKVNEDYQLIYSPMGIDIAWESGNDQVVTVDSDGKLHGVKAGVATVTATTNSGSTASITVIVENIPYVISNIPSEITLYEGQSFDISGLTIDPKPLEDDKLTWQFSVQGIANYEEEDSAGRKTRTITGTSVGTTTLTFKIADTQFDVNITVLRKQESTQYVKLTADKTSIVDWFSTMNKSGTISIQNNTTSGISNPEYKIESSGDGVIQATLTNAKQNSCVLNYTVLSEGVTSITISFKGTGSSTSQNITYSGAITIFFEIKAEIYVDLIFSTNVVSGYIEDMATTGTITIKNSANVSIGYTYTNENGRVVSLDFGSTNVAQNSFKYTILGTGVAKVTIKTFGNAHVHGSGVIYFYIMNKPVIEPEPDIQDSVSFNVPSITIQEGNSGKFAVVTGSFDSCSFVSSDPSICSVTTYNNQPTFTAHKAGECTITAATGRGAIATLKVIVTEYIKDQVYFNTDEITLTVGNTGKYAVVGGRFDSCSFTSSNTAVCVVTASNNQPVFEAKSVGDCVITATTGRGATATLKVKVVKSQTSEPTEPDQPTIPDYYIDITKTSITLDVGQKAKVDFTTNSSEKRVWTSTNEAVAKLSKTNNDIYVEGIAAGQATIKVLTVVNGKNYIDTCTVIVKAAATVTIKLEVSSTVINIGDSATIKAITTPSGITVNWTIIKNDTSDYKQIISSSHDENNFNILNIKGLNAGTVSITAFYGSASASTKVTVQAEKTYSKYIYNLTQLNNIRYFLNKDFVLAADINVGDWTPIGTAVNPFTGTFTALKKSNGSYYTLGNVNVKSTTYAGLFGYARNATFTGVTIRNTGDATIQGNYVGAIAGYAYNTKFDYCVSYGNNIVGPQYVGGIVGYSCYSVLNYCKTKTYALSSDPTKPYYSKITCTSSTGYVGGITGYLYCGAAIYSDVVSLVSFSSAGHGYAGGVAGYSCGRISNACVGSSTISASTSNGQDHAGGIVGKSISTIESCTVKTTSISGYYAGGIGAELIAPEKITLKFSNYKDGFRLGDISSKSYEKTVFNTAVRETVTVSGVKVGGLFGLIVSGVVENCYTRATIKGTAGDSVKGGFASEIRADGNFNNNGGTGNAGLVIYCYAAVTFSGSGTAYAITSSLVHNYSSVNNGTGRAGYCIQYLFDDGTDGNADYVSGSGLNVFGSQDNKIGAKKSTSDMKNRSTYTDRGFSTSIWSIYDGKYAALKDEQ